jgi:hypothetical protein
MNGLSQRIVDYVAELMPLYTFQFADGRDCALSLMDGTLLMPVDESSTEREEGWVAVLWQGDAQRRSEVPGPLMAYQAALRCAEFHGIGRLPAEVASHRHILLTRLRDICGDLLHIEMVTRL